jgi:hypothetical protein
LIEVWSLGQFLAVAGEVAIAEVVSEDKDDVWLPGFLRV